MKISNMAELKTRRGTTGFNVNVLGYYSVGDGGGGEFYWDNTSTETDNGGTVIQVAGLTNGRWKRILNTDVLNVKWFGAKGDNIQNDTLFIQKAIDTTNKDIVFSKGNYKITSPLLLENKNLKTGKYTAFINAYGCDAFTCMRGTNNSIEGFYIIGFSSLGVIDLKEKNGIKCDGISGETSFGNTFKDLYIRGFANAILMNYTWDTVIDSVRSIYCVNGVTLFGQSVNNFISNSNILATECCIETIKDVGGIKGEGLGVSNTLLASSNYGIKSDGFLLIQLSNVNIDQISISCVILQNCNDFHASSCWFYSNQDAIVFSALGSIVEQNSSISNSTIQSVEAIGINIDTNNSHISITNNNIKTGSTGVPFILKTQIQTSDIVFIGNTCKSDYVGSNIFIGGDRTIVKDNTGNCSINYFDFSKRNIIGDNTSNAIQTYNTAPPTTGTWKQGDIVYNVLPTSGSYIGWVCTVAGTAGTWKGFGLIV